MNLQAILANYWRGAEILRVELEENAGLLCVYFKSDRPEGTSGDAEEEIRQALQLDYRIELIRLGSDTAENFIVILRHQVNADFLDQVDVSMDGEVVQMRFFNQESFNQALEKEEDMVRLAKQWPTEAQDLELLLLEAEEEVTEAKLYQEREALLASVRVSDKTSTDQNQGVQKVATASFRTEDVDIIRIFEDESVRRVRIRGELLSKESRPIPGKRMVMTMGLYDGTASIGVKIICKEEEHKKHDDAFKVGNYYAMQGRVNYDIYAREMMLQANQYQAIPGGHVPPDRAVKKRVELSVHTNMSEIDGVADIEDYIKRAKAWGHPAIAITDVNSVHAFPKAYDLAAKQDIKILYGMEALVFDDLTPFLDEGLQEPFRGEFVAVDIETTGLNRNRCELIEIGAAKIRNLEIVDTFSALIKPVEKIPDYITELTGIRNEDVALSKSAAEVLPEFMEFLGEAPLVAHNAQFDYYFLKSELEKIGMSLNNPLADTLFLSRLLMPEMKRFGLKQVSRRLKIKLEQHHRAMEDAFVCGRIFIHFLLMLEAEGVRAFQELLQRIDSSFMMRSRFKKNVSLIAKNQQGIRVIYELLSDASLRYLDGQRPSLPLSLLFQQREHLWLGSGDAEGFLVDAIISGEKDEELQRIAAYFDYLEVLPMAGYRPLLNRHLVKDETEIRSIQETIVQLGERMHIPVCATSHARYIDESDHLYRNIVLLGQNKGLTPEYGSFFYRSTDEMLQEFSFLGEDKAQEIVLQNPHAIAEQVDILKPYPSGKFPPVLEGAEEELRHKCYEKAQSLYGTPLPEYVQKRLDYELDAIIKNGFAVLYIIAEKLVKQSMSMGYLVGSRGSVGSSFAATMGGITEVNPLIPHYYCPDCHRAEFIEGEEYKNGFDMPDRECPSCKKRYHKDGFNIPFESFMGFEGNKEPDIDLNFAPMIQADIHKYTEDLFGKGRVFKAGTVSKVAERTAYGYVLSYLEDHGKEMNGRDVDRLVQRIIGVRRSSGQHPGGIIVVPSDREITEFTPIQYPANDPHSGVITTHFDYDALKGRLLKLDILGHEIPGIIRDLEEMTGVSASSIAFDDKRVISIFNATDELKLTDPDYKGSHGTLGIPEYGTQFVRQMLEETKPQNFEDLVRISGLSHGTDVWTNNAQELVRSGKLTLKDVIATREQIMLYGIEKGLERDLAFGLMEKVKKGKRLSEEEIQSMRGVGIPEWYIDSCNKMSYMFPKAHAVAYVMMSFRIAYYKVYYPLAFYASYFTTRVEDFNGELICRGVQAVRQRLREIEEMEKPSKKEQDVYTLLEVVEEMYARGFHFSSAELMESQARRFEVIDGKIRIPLQGLDGIGETAAQGIVEARKDGNFMSIEDLQQRARLNKVAIEALDRHGCLQGMSQSNQLDLFGMMGL